LHDKWGNDFIPTICNDVRNVVCIGYMIIVAKSSIFLNKVDRNRGFWGREEKNRPAREI
jgi:hypothetical protein